MRVRMRVSMSGARDNENWPGVGETLVLGDDEAMELQRAGIADLVPEDDIAAHSVAAVDDSTGRAVEDPDAAADLADTSAGVDERAVEFASTEHGTSSRKAARGGRVPEPKAKAPESKPDPPRGIQPGQR